MLPLELRRKYTEMHSILALRIRTIIVTTHFRYKAQIGCINSFFGIRKTYHVCKMTHLKQSFKDLMSVIKYNISIRKQKDFTFLWFPHPPTNRTALLRKELKLQPPALMLGSSPTPFLLLDRQQ